jgi:cytochrome P450 family 6
MGVVTFFFTFIIGTASFIFYFLHRRKTHWKRKNVPHIEPEILFGNARGVNTTVYIGHFFRDMYLKMKSMGPIVGLNLYTEPVMMVTDLDLIKTILVKDFNYFPNRGLYHNEKDDPVSGNLSAIEDDEWRSLRNKLTPTFTSGKIKMMFPLIGEVAEKMIERISIEGKNGSIEVKDIHSRFTTDVIGKVAFGVECNSLDDNTTRFYQMGLKGFSKMTAWKNFLVTNYSNFSRRMRIKTFDAEVTGFYKDVIAQTIKYRDENNVQSNDFMSLLIKMLKDSTLSFNQVWAQSVVFFLAGYETTATALTYCIYELSQHEDIQKKARESIRKVLKEHDGEFTYEAVNEMQYVEQCVNGEHEKLLPLQIYQNIFNFQRHCGNIHLHQ